MSGQYSLGHAIAFGVIAGCGVFLLSGLLSPTEVSQHWVQAPVTTAQPLIAQVSQVSGRTPKAIPRQELQVHAGNAVTDVILGDQEMVAPTLSAALKWQPILVVGSVVSSLIALYWARQQHSRDSWTMASTAEETRRKATIQFIRGIDELATPGVRLTRSRDGSNGQATFRFDKPSAFDAANELGQITGMYMTDDEGTVSTAQVTAKFINGVPSSIEAVYTMRSKDEWDRFMRFMERYAEANGMGFNKA